MENIRFNNTLKVPGQNIRLNSQPRTNEPQLSAQNFVLQFPSQNTQLQSSGIKLHVTSKQNESQSTAIKLYEPSQQNKFSNELQSTAIKLHATSKQNEFPNELQSTGIKLHVPSQNTELQSSAIKLHAPIQDSTIPERRVKLELPGENVELQKPRHTIKLQLPSKKNTLQVPGESDFSQRLQNDNTFSIPAQNTNKGNTLQVPVEQIQLQSPHNQTLQFSSRCNNLSATTDTLHLPQEQGKLQLGIPNDNCVLQLGQPERLNLPERFRPKQYSKYTMTYTTIKPQASCEDVTIGIVIEPDCDDIVTTEVNEEPAPTTGICSENDLSQALTWIKHQVMLLKQEDKDLMERFYEIRAKINKLRNTFYNESLAISPNNTNSASDPNINNSQSEDVDFVPSSLNEDEYLGEFRSRTTSLLAPRTQLTVVRPSMNRLSKAEQFL